MLLFHDWSLRIRDTFILYICIYVYRNGDRDANPVPVSSVIYLVHANTETILYTEVGSTITFDETNVATSRYMMSSRDSTHRMILLKYMIMNEINKLHHNTPFTKCSDIGDDFCNIFI